MTLGNAFTMSPNDAQGARVALAIARRWVRRIEELNKQNRGLPVSEQRVRPVVEAILRLGKQETEDVR